MFKVTKRSSSRVDIELEGALDADTMRKGLDQLVDNSQDVENGRMLYRIGEFKMPTLEAVGVELGKIPEMFSLIGKYDKCAVLSDADWVRKVAEVKGALFPGMEIKSFPIAEQEAAEAWLGS